MMQIGQVVNKDSPRPDFMTGRQWRSMRSRMRKMGGPYRAWWHDAWQYVREEGGLTTLGADRRAANALAGRGPAHFIDRAILAAESCHAARELG